MPPEHCKKLLFIGPLKAERRTLPAKWVLARSGHTAEPNIMQMDSNGDGNATVGWGWTLNRDPIPQTPIWGPLLAPFSRKTRKKPEILSTNRDFFLFRYISGSRGRIDKVETGLISVPPPDLNPEKSGGIRGYAAYPGKWAPKSLHTTLLVRSLSRSAKCLVVFGLRCG